MSLSWTQENPALWDDGKRAVLSAAPGGSLPAYQMGADDSAPGDWWRVEKDGEVVGYGWMDTVWGDAEILLAVAPGAQGDGVGTFILAQLELEASKRGLNHIYNTVLPTHPERQQVMGWLGRRGFSGGDDHEQLRRVVRKA